jgi:hypothetical protein
MTPNGETFLGNTGFSVVGDLASQFAPSVPEAGSNVLALLGGASLIIIRLLFWKSPQA